MLNLAPQLCLLVPSRCVNAPFLAALCFSVLLTFSLALSVCLFFLCFNVLLSAQTLLLVLYSLSFLLLPLQFPFCLD